ncbi:MAG: hypothetical protein Q4A23_01100 [bacterium]|nr:hypothetical protein [bacterium]
MKIKQTNRLLPVIAVATLALGGGVYATNLFANSTYQKADAFTTATNPIDPTNAQDNYIIKFSDEKFKKALNSELIKKAGLTRQITDDITFGDAKKLTIFWPEDKYRNFSNLEGIQYFTNLEFIHIHGIETVEDISPMRDLVNIKTAYLSATGIKDLSPLEKLKNLELLWIHQINATDFSVVSKLPKLNNVYDLQSEEQTINLSKGQAIVKNPMVNWDGTPIEIIEKQINEGKSASIINSDAAGNPQKDGGYIKVITQDYQGNIDIEALNTKLALPNGTKFDNEATHKTRLALNVDIDKTLPTFTSENKNYTDGQTVKTLDFPAREELSSRNLADQVKASKGTVSINYGDLDIKDPKFGDYTITYTANDEYGNSAKVFVKVKITENDKTKLKDALNKLSSQKKYIVEDFPQSIKSTAESIISNKNASKDEINKAVSDIEIAIEKIIAEETKRIRKAQDAIDKLELGYNIKKYEDVLNARKAIRELKDDEAKKAMDQEFQKAFNTYLGLYSDLQQLVETAKSIKNLEHYSKETADNFTKALNKAKEYFTEDGESDQNDPTKWLSSQDINLLHGTLEDAMNDLRFDKTTLTQEITNFKNSPDWIKNDADIQAEIKNAEEINEQENPTYEDITEAANKLANKLKELKNKELSRQDHAKQAVADAEKKLEANKADINKLPEINLKDIEKAVEEVKDPAEKEKLTQKIKSIKESIANKQKKIEDDKAQKANEIAKEKLAQNTKKDLSSPKTGIQQKESRVDILSIIAFSITLPSLIFATFRKIISRN